MPQLASSLGVSERTLRRYHAEGVIEPAVPGRGRKPAQYDLVAVARTLISQPDSPRDEKDRAQAELTRLKVSREKGDLVRADKVLTDSYACARVVQAQVLAVPDRMAPLLAAESDPGAIHLALSVELRAALTSTAEILGDEPTGKRRRNPSPDDGDDDDE